MRKILSFALLLALWFDFSCKGRGGDCEDEDLKPKPPYYSLSALKAGARHITDTTSDGYYNFEEISGGDTIPFDRLYILLSSKQTYHSSNQLPFICGTPAYACDPVMPGYLGTKEKLDTFIVTSDQDFNSTHPVGSPLNEYFSYTMNSRPFESRPLTEFNASLPAVGCPPVFQLRLMNKPDVTSLNFFIHYHFTNGQVMNAGTGTIFLK